MSVETPSYAIGPVRLQFGAKDPRLTDWAAALHVGRETEQPPDIRVQLCIGAETYLSPSPPEVSTEGQTDQLRYRSWYGTWDRRAGTCRAELSANTDDVRGPRRIATLARTLVSRRLLERGGLAFHAAAMIKDGLGYLFVGPSGAGKTTVARTWPGDAVLGDDCAIVAPDEEGRFVVHGAPYSGREGTPNEAGSAPLAKILVLTQARDTRVEPLSTPSAVWEILSSVIHFGVSKRDAGTALDTLTRLVRGAETARLHFDLTTPLWPALIARSTGEEH